MSQRILLVEDDFELGDEIFETLLDEDFDVTWIKEGDEAYREEPGDYDLVILDLMLPGKHGFDILKEFRESSDVPVLILTARQETDTKVRGFKLGGDDYLTKPFWPEELLARVQARLRRPVMQREADRTVGPIALDFEARQVTVDGESVDMTRVEFDLLERLANRPGTAVSRRALVDHALDEAVEGARRTLDVHISRIRKKLGDAADHLETVWGVGYRLTDKPGES